MSDQNTIPFLDLVAPHVELKDELIEVFQTALNTAGFIGGPMVQGLEEDFASYCGARYCVGVSSGTDALRFALMAAGITHDDIVVTVPNTFIATTEAISQAGAEVAFVDVDEATYNLDLAKLRVYIETQCKFDTATRTLRHKKSGRRIAAVVPVHLYGQMADMDAIQELAEQYNFQVFEDACQAHGAEYFSKRQNRWRRAGSVGLAAAFSFYPGKNLGACGEAGAVTTDDELLAKKMRMLRDHGQSRKYIHEMEGYNGRLDAIQAGFLRVKLRRLEQWNEQRRQIGRVYDELLAEAGDVLVLPSVSEWARPVFHLYVVRVGDRETLQRELNAAGIATGIHYPIPLHLLPPYRALGYRQGDFPIAERAAEEVLSLPMFPGLTPDNQRRVAEELLRLLSIRRQMLAS